MPYPNDFKKNGSSLLDNDLVLTTDDVSSCNEHVIRCTAGSLDVEITVDEGLDPVDQWTDSSTFPISVMLLNATNPSTWVIQVDAGQAAVLTGRYDRVRLRQKGAVASAAHISSYRR